MIQSPMMTVDDIHVAENYGTVLLLFCGLALLALGVLAAGWAPIELPLGLATLGTVALALFYPSRWQGEEASDTLNSLVLASLITLAGFHLLV